MSNKAVKFVALFLGCFFMVSCDWFGIGTTPTTTTNPTTSFTTSGHNTSSSEPLTTPTSSLPTTSTQTSTVPHPTTTLRIGKWDVVRDFESRYLELLANSKYAYQSSLFQEVSDVSSFLIYDSLRVDTSIHFDAINQLITYYSEDSRNTIVSVVIDLRNQLRYDYYAEDGNLYKDVIDGEEYFEFLDSILTSDEDYLSLTILSGLPEWTTFEIIGDHRYFVAFSVYDLFEYDAEFATEILGLYEPAHSPYDYSVTFLVDLSDGLSLSVNAQRYPTNEFGTRLNTVTRFMESMTIPDEWNPKAINENHYYETTFDNPTDCDRSYDSDTRHEVLILPEADNYFRFVLEPGYYNVDLSWKFSSQFHATLYDSNMNEVSFQGFYKIETPTTYYLNVTTDERDETPLEMTFYSYPEEEVGTIDNPLMAESELRGTIAMGEVEYHYLLRNSRKGYVVVTMTGTDFGFINISYGSNFRGLWLGSSLGFLVEEGQDLILILKGEMESIHFVVSWEFREIPEPTSDFASMPEMSMGERMLLPICSPYFTQYVKFDITEDAEYRLLRFVDFNLTNNYEYRTQLYTDQGVFLSEFDQNQDTVLYLESGSYYIVVSGNGDHEFVLSFLITKVTT